MRSVRSLRSLIASKVSIIALVLTATFAGAQASPQIVLPAITNFGQINEDYYRGGQPDRAGFDALKRLGVKTVIDLQEDGKKEEPQWAREAGLRYFNIPLSSKRPATPAQTAYFLKLVTDSSNWPVYVHCAGGRHRTGAMTAVYRITHDLWTADQAYQEMKIFKFYSFGGHGSLKKFVYDYYQSFQQLKATGGSPATGPATAGSTQTVARVAAQG